MPLTSGTTLGPIRSKPRSACAGWVRSTRPATRAGQREFGFPKGNRYLAWPTILGRAVAFDGAVRLAA